MDVEPSRDVTSLAVLRVGRVAAAADVLNPYVLLDADGREVAAVGEFLRSMTADGSPATTLRSYCYELLSWMRFLLCAMQGDTPVTHWRLRACRRCGSFRFARSHRSRS